MIDDPQDVSTKEELKEFIHAIPGGEEGWWDSSGEEHFLEASEKLMLLGMTPNEVAHFLDEMYSAVRCQYGD